MSCGGVTRSGTADGGGDENNSVSFGRRAVLRGIAGAVLTVGVGQAAARHSDPSTHTKRDVTIESWDGTDLACTLFEPKSAGPKPAMLMTHGWGGDRSEAFAPEVFATHGYVVLTYDSRGFGESGGEANSDGPPEVKDCRRLITWLGDSDGQRNRPTVKNDGQSDHGPNPRVGMIGPSYAGGIQLNTAARDDRLNAIVPIIPWYDLSFSLEPNNVVKQGWGALLYAVGITGTRGFTSGDGHPSKEDLRNGLDSNLHEAFVEGTVTNGFDDNTETWYEERSVSSKLPFIESWDTPTLTIEGWPDTLFIPNEGIWIQQALAERGADSRLTLYNSGHVLELITNPKSLQTQSEAALRRGLSFINEHLMDGKRGNRSTGGHDRVGPTKQEPIEWFEVQGGKALAPDSWSTARKMPPQDTTQRAFALADAETRQSGQTVVVNSVAPTASSQLSPQNHDSLGTSANFDFPVEDAYEVVGTPHLSAQVQLLGNATHLFWKFYHVRNGTATLVNNQVMPFRIERDRDAPSEPVTVEGELVAFQRYLKKNDTLRLTVATTDAGFNSARQSGGAAIDHTNSSVALPVRNWDGTRE